MKLITPPNQSGFNASSGRTGFTLVELLVVIAIILILLTMTILAVNFTKDGDRVRGAAGQVQSFLAGARDRAIYSKEPRGVRFFVSPDNPRAVTTMAYIAPGGTWGSENSGNVSLERVDINNDGDLLDTNLEYPSGSNVFRDESDVFIVRGKQNPGWWNLKRRGWLVNGLRMRIPKGPTGNWYPIDTSLIKENLAPTSDQLLILQIPYADGGKDGLIAHTDLTYEIELPAKLLAQDPSILPESVLIDLDSSKIPDAWRPQVVKNGGSYSGYMDIIFSPRGNILGDAAGAGVMHLYVCDAEDSLFLKERFESKFGSRPAYTSNTPFIPMDEIPSTFWVSSENNYLTKDRRLVSVFTQTGSISVHEVNGFFSATSSATGDALDPFDVNANGNKTEPDGLADDPYYFAETGKVAK